MQGLSDTRPGQWPHGVVSRAELLAAGLSSGAIEHHLRTGRLFGLYRGVYAVGRRDVTVDGRRRAAVLACGPTATLSHRSAAAFWGLPPSSGRWEVTVRVKGRRSPAPNVRVLRHRTLADDEVTMRRAIPVTTPARTLLDLAGVVPAHHLRRAVERADQLELFDLRALTAVMAAHPRWPGGPALRTLLDDLADHGTTTMTRSDLEALFLQLCLDHGLERPQVNRFDGVREVDFRWTAQRLVVETDGWAFHRTRAAFERDHVTRLALQAQGWRVVAVTARQVRDDPGAVAAAVGAVLLAGAA